MRNCERRRHGLADRARQSLKFAGLAAPRDPAGMGPELDRRQGRRDRRDNSRPAIAPGVERRVNQGCRRLPEPRWRQWPSILAAAVLGVVAAVALQGLQADASEVEPAPVEVAVAAPPVVASRAPISLSEAQALHDEAAALTPAGVAFDETAHATWLPQIGRLEAAAADPGLSPEIREELAATLAALSNVGLGRGRP
ncbi:hypothetical protein [Nannocystis punicea]|uniref:Anti-sigma factor n=1 Tax=Nannocystis punicea TaxID=2995304 RepID=A0ABY7H0T9_9BACT|nr:hypothetical protein [Nannocystis poenicansa]WAS92865.1 hypothetical protein O0S08_42380 [Nannocystis poenicansa]